MKRLIARALCLACTAAMAEDEAVIDELEVRLSEIEVIDVTSEKEPVESPEVLDEDVDALLEELEALEADEAEE